MFCHQNRQQFFISLVSDANNETEKIKRIYRYLQENFRYVSIQLGIGGLKPFSATFTDQKKYGDCKALSNYMKAALHSVGIRSHVAIINAEYNEEPVDPDFPANGFNHVILCIPGKTDSTWLECTSNTAAFGELGTFTENRNALLITENGGMLVPTPQSESSSNYFSTYTDIKMNDDFSALSATTIAVKGAFSEIIGDMLKQNKDDQKTTIVSGLGYKQPDNFVLSPSPDKQHTVLNMELRKLSEFNSGAKYFIKPRISKGWHSKLPSADNRKLDFYFRYPFERYDTTVIRLVAGLKTEVLPKEKQLENPYGFYQTRSWYNSADNSLYTATTLILKKHKVLAADYRLVKSFFDEVILDEEQRIVLNKTEVSTPKPKAF